MNEYKRNSSLLRLMLNHGGVLDHKVVYLRRDKIGEYVLCYVGSRLVASIHQKVVKIKPSPYRRVFENFAGKHHKQILYRGSIKTYGGLRKCTKLDWYVTPLVGASPKITPPDEELDIRAVSPPEGYLFNAQWL